jgi:hypothetical protein
MCFATAAITRAPIGLLVRLRLSPDRALHTKILFPGEAYLVDTAIRELFFGATWAERVRVSRSTALESLSVRFQLPTKGKCRNT